MTRIKICLGLIAILLVGIMAIITSTNIAYADTTRKLVEGDYTMTSQFDNNRDFVDVKIYNGGQEGWEINLGTLTLHDFDIYHYGIAPDDSSLQTWDDIKISYADGKIALAAKEPTCTFGDWNFHHYKYEQTRSDGLAAIFYFADGTKNHVTIDAKSSDTTKVGNKKQVTKIRICLWNYHNYNTENVAEINHFYNLDRDCIMSPDNSETPAKRIYWPPTEAANARYACFNFEGAEYYDTDWHHTFSFNDDKIQYWYNTYVCFIDDKITFSSIDTYRANATSSDIYNDGLRAIVYFKDGSATSLTIDACDFESKTTNKQPKDVLYIEIQPWNSHSSRDITYCNKSRTDDLNNYYLKNFEANLNNLRSEYKHDQLKLYAEMEKVLRKVQSIFASVPTDYFNDIDLNLRRKYYDQNERITNAYYKKSENIYAKVDSIAKKYAHAPNTNQLIERDINCYINEMSELAKMFKRLDMKYPQNQNYTQFLELWQKGNVSKDNCIALAQFKTAEKAVKDTVYEKYQTDCTNAENFYNSQLALYEKIEKEYQETKDKDKYLEEKRAHFDYGYDQRELFEDFQLRHNIDNAYNTLEKAKGCEV